MDRRPFFVKFRIGERAESVMFFYVADIEAAITEHFAGQMWYRPEFAEIHEGNYYNHDICGAFLKRFAIPAYKYTGNY